MAVGTRDLFQSLVPFFAIEPFNVTNHVPSGQFDVEPFEGKM